MIKVKISLPYSAPPIIRQTKGNKGIWDNCEFFINSTVEECDYWFVLDELESKESTLCPPENIILITGEPPFVKLYPQKYIKQFAKLFTCQNNLLHKKNAICSIPVLPWMVGAKLKTIPHIWDTNNYLDYDFFCKECYTERKDKVAVITSNKVITKGHKKRLEFILNLKQEIPDLLDIFGAGFVHIDDKFDVLSQYKYSLVIENCEYANYWTEKLADTFLCETFPFYNGCPNILDYFSEQSLEIIKFEDVKYIAKFMKTNIENNCYQDAITSLKEAKNLILNKYNLFAYISDYIQQQEKKHDKNLLKCQCDIYPYQITNELRIRSRILRYLRVEL